MEVIKINGVYQISVNGLPVHVGESRNVLSRIGCHQTYINSAAKGRYNDHWELWTFLGAQLKAGHDISFHIVTNSPDYTKNDRLEAEKASIAAIRAHDHPLPFNNQHEPLSQITKDKISAKRTGVSQGQWQWTAQQKANLALVMTGNKNRAKGAARARNDQG